LLWRSVPVGPAPDAPRIPDHSAVSKKRRNRENRARFPAACRRILPAANDAISIHILWCSPQGLCLKQSGRVRHHVPTSVVLAQLLAEAPPDYVSPAWLIGRLQKRSFGLVMLLLALVSLLPGAGILAGILLGFPAVQMILGRESPSLPRFLASRRISTRHIAGLARAVPLLERMEALIHPRLPTPFEVTKRLIGFIVLLLAATFVSPVPFSQIIPALVIVLISFAYLEEDGVLLCISLVAALVSLSVTAATIWATLRATGLIEKP
jgi:hypothetical protein